MSERDYPPGWGPQSEFFYQRTGRVARLRLVKLTNHELRDVIVGLWARLDAADRADFIKEVTEYNGAGPGFLGAIASQISRAVAGEAAIDLIDVPIRHLPLDDPSDGT